MALKYELRRVINEIAELVRKIYTVDGPVSDIDSVVSRMGGRVIENPDIYDFSDGQIRKISNSEFEIIVSPFQSLERRNFAIAHELGHLFLHMDFMTDSDKLRKQSKEVYYRNGSSELEYQANEFAAAFLMPRKDYKNKLDEHIKGNMANTEKIARYFFVSIDAAVNIEETTNKLNCKLSDSNCFKKIIYPLSIPVYHSKYPNSIPLFTAASIDTKKYLAIFSVFAILPFICSSNLFLFVVSSIFIGFSTTALAIFSVLSSHKMAVKVAQTSVMSEKISRFTKSLKCMAVSMIIFLSSIFGIFDFLKISRLFLVIGLFLFLTGFAYYLIASCDLIKMVKILYSVDEGKKQQTIADFEKELRK